MIMLQKLKEQLYGPCRLQPELCSTVSHCATPFLEETLEKYPALAAVGHSIAEVVLQTLDYVLIQLKKQVNEPSPQQLAYDCVQSSL